jgi:hypothetical protein
MHTNRVDTCGNPIREVDAGNYPASDLSELLDVQCYANILHPTKSRCPNLAKWKGRGAGNFTDEWKWCDEHAPNDPFREAI